MGACCILTVKQLPKNFSLRLDCVPTLRPKSNVTVADRNRGEVVGALGCLPEMERSCRRGYSCVWTGRTAFGSALDEGSQLGNCHHP